MSLDGAVKLYNTCLGKGGGGVSLGGAVKLYNSCLGKGGRV